MKVSVPSCVLGTCFSSRFTDFSSSLVTTEPNCLLSALTSSGGLVIHLRRVCAPLFSCDRFRVHARNSSKEEIKFASSKFDELSGAEALFSWSKASESIVFVNTFIFYGGTDPWSVSGVLCFSNRHGSISSSSSITTACVSDFNRSGAGPGGGRFTGKSASRQTLPSKNNFFVIVVVLSVVGCVRGDCVCVCVCVCCCCCLGVILLFCCSDCPPPSFCSMFLCYKSVGRSCIVRMYTGARAHTRVYML